MFTKPLSYIITKANLQDSYEKVSKKSFGIDDIDFNKFEENLSKNFDEIVKSIQEATYVPEPLKKIEIEKPESDKKRPIALGSIKDKLVQRVLYDNLNPYFDKRFSEDSYAYRPNKSASKAINKMTAYLNQKNLIVVKSDIENFFETIDHDILLSLLNKEIKDKKLIRLISLFIQIGGFKEQDYDEHLSGVYQGDILSPLLSNIYLDVMDKYLEKQEVKFVRYADDFTMFFDAKNKNGFSRYVEELNSYLRGLKNYYLKILTKNSSQYLELQQAVIDSVAHKIYLAKKNRDITTKKEFKIVLSQINFNILFDDQQIKIEINHIIAIAYEKYLASKSYKDTTTKITKKRNQYAKKFANDTTLHIATPGLMLGISKNKFVVKKYGKVQSSYPINHIKRIVFEGKGFSLSTNVIKKCADNAITIDFISNDAQNYASLITYKASMTQMVNKQAKLLGTPTHLELAKAFIRGKAKNQLNYIKYLNKYHKLMGKHIHIIESNIVKLNGAESVNALMGYEGSISATYWDAIKLILDVPFEKRITLGAKDIVNSSLNYAYAFLYGKVQHLLVHAGLSLNISFLHSLDDKKPTLTYDMIEEFRTFIVDRTIVSMLNKDEPIRLGNDGRLTQASRKRIAKHIKEKLGSYTMWKKESKKVENIIQIQCYNLAKVVNGDIPKYKAFIGKF